MRIIEEPVKVLSQEEAIAFSHNAHLRQRTNKPAPSRKSYRVSHRRFDGPVDVLADNEDEAWAMACDKAKVSIGSRTKNDGHVEEIEIKPVSPPVSDKAKAKA